MSALFNQSEDGDMAYQGSSKRYSSSPLLAVALCAEIIPLIRMFSPLGIIAQVVNEMLCFL